jgi:hypothetical protein
MAAMSSVYDCTNVVDIADEPHHHLVIANQYVRVFSVDVPAHTRTLCHRHPNEYLLYVASGAEIVSAARDDQPKRLSYCDGECELSKAGLEHVVENLGDGAFRNVVVELSAAGASLKRGTNPVVMKGAARMDQILSEVPGAVFRLELDPDAEVEIAGPAIVSSPQGDELMIKELEEFHIPLNSFFKPMWVCAPRKIVLKNLGQRAGTAVAFDVGAASM